MRLVLPSTLVLVLALLSTAPSPAHADILTASGKLTLLRVHDKGTKYGPLNDQINVEVVLQLDSESGKAFGFTLRDDKNQAAHQGMLDLLRDALWHDWTVHIDYDSVTGKKNSIVVRVWLEK